MIRRLLGSLFLIVALTLSRPVGVPGARAEDTPNAPDTWAALGPVGPSQIRAVASSDDWQSGGLIVAARANDLVRSLDAGRTWVSLPLPGPGITALHVALTPAGRLVLAAHGRTGQETVRAVLRSTDDGASWQQVLESPIRETVAPGGQVIISPASAEDGLLFALLDGRLFRSDDAGAAWAAVEPVPDQRVQAVAISPAFAQDRTIFVAAISGGFPSVASSRPSGPADDHERSAGVLVSTDAGVTWAPANVGLEAEGAPYRHVQSLAISPTFARDGTLFVGAWGPRPPTDYSGSTIYLPRTALFRSRDRGVTWERSSARADRRTIVALSPAFAGDGVAILSTSGEFASPASHSCTVSRTADGGDTWEQVIRPGSYEGCSDLRLSGGGADGVAVVWKGPGWLLSTDGGRTWAGLNPPVRLGSSLVTVAPPPPLAPPAGPQPLLFGTGFGVWAFGRGLTETAGSLPCPAEATAGFGRVVRESTVLRVRLGCPLAPERPVSLRVALPGDDPRAEGAFSVDDGSGRWLMLTNARDPVDSYWMTPGPRSTWTPPLLEPIPGAGQEFDGGTLYFFVTDAGERTILAVGPRDAGGGWWLRFAD